MAMSIIVLGFVSSCDFSQRTGIADGGEFYIRPPGTAAWLFDKDKY
jgi:hypothetical protein